MVLSFSLALRWRWFHQRLHFSAVYIFIIRLNDLKSASYSDEVTIADRGQSSISARRPVNFLSTTETNHPTMVGRGRIAITYFWSVLDKRKLISKLVFISSHQHLHQSTAQITLINRRELRWVSFSFVLVWRVGIHTVIYQYNIVQNAGQQLGKPDEQQPLVWRSGTGGTTLHPLPNFSNLWWMAVQAGRGYRCKHYANKALDVWRTLHRAGAAGSRK